MQQPNALVTADDEYRCVAPASMASLNPRCHSVIPAQRVRAAVQHKVQPRYCSDTCEKRQRNISYIIATAKKLGLK